MDNLRWLPIIVLCFFVGMFRIGYSPLPWLLIAEILPTEVKNWAMSSIVCYSWLLTFIVTKLFPPLVDFYGYPVVYGIFGGINFFSVWFTCCLVPETKHKSATEIRDAIGKKSSYVKIESEEQLLTTEEEEI